ncbi:hypothetical protein D9757_010056 [Collybiopsis confluens]|uniref:Fungal-type protein kinase domain-containing protein n=1 Tax=Collybiopsis confluens TaxID=2823264 RepID=A0A8H5GZX5_9AGAR|nr:hypothetical protein D9757_010056 [Collybiopsis confluens]
MANIMYRREGDNVYGVLNDFDLSSFLTHMDKSLTSKHRTGTKPFMACDLLNTQWDKGHLYRHDLESMFYVILIVSCHNTGPLTRASSLRYEDWFNGVDQFIGYAKTAFLQSCSPELPVQTYFKGFALWLHEIRLMLGMGLKSRPLEKVVSFDWDALQGNVAYAKTMEVMRLFDEEELVTHWDGGDITVLV